MKIIHIADLHWRGISRHAEYSRSFENLFDQLRAIKPDLIINAGDTFHTKTQGITPESIERLAWMFRKLAAIAPTYSILGNHDGNLTNLGRQDIISPIHNAINDPGAFVIKNSMSVDVPNTNVRLYAFSPFDKDGWKALREAPKDTSLLHIAIYHGPVYGCRGDNDRYLDECDTAIEFFKGFDFAMLGDIHKHQLLDLRKDINGVQKGWIAYPGSLLQQNFGESERKGYLLWDIRSRDDWDVEFKELPNLAPFVTIKWQGDVTSTLKHTEEQRKERAFLPGSRFRISSNIAIPSVDVRKMIIELKENRKAHEVTFKYDPISKIDHIDAMNGKKISKTSLKNNPDTILRLYFDYLKVHVENYCLTEAQINLAEEMIRNYMSNLRFEYSTASPSTMWSIKSFKFDNIFGYGEDNSINFDKLNGIVGIFGFNRIGKSSIVGGLMYTLFNTTDRGPMKNAHIINRSKNYCKGEVRISVGGTDYIVERRTDRIIPKGIKTAIPDDDRTNTTLNLYRIAQNSKGQEIKVVENSVSRDDTDKVIRQLIGTSSDFLLTALSSQGNIDRFINEGPTERKKILARFLELDVFEKLYDLAKTEQTNLMTKSYNLGPDGSLSVIKNAKKNIATVELKLEKVDSTLEDIRSEKDQLKLWLMQHERDAEGVDQPNIDSIQTKLDDHNKQLKTKTTELNHIRKALVDNTRKLVSCKNAKKRIDIETLRNEYEDYVILKNTVNDLRHELAAQESILKNQQKAVRKLENVPCGTQFPTCHFIKDSSRDKKRLANQEILVKKMANQHATDSALLEEYVSKKLQKTIDRWEELDRKEFVLGKTIDTDRRNRDYLKGQIKLIKNDVQKSSSALKALKKKVNFIKSKEYKEKKLAYGLIETKALDIEKQRADVLMELGSKKEILSRLLLRAKESQEIIERLTVCESILHAFSKNGIPAMVLKSQLPAINLELEKILDGVVNFKVSLETDATSNAMDVYISDDKQKRIIETTSGMEKNICSLALRVALTNLSSLPKPDMIIIDEGFSALDEENTQSCMELLSFLRTYFKTIIVITHIGPLKEIAERIIEIRNDGTESKVEY